MQAWSRHTRPKWNDMELTEGTERRSVETPSRAFVDLVASAISGDASEPPHKIRTFSASHYVREPKSSPRSTSGKAKEGAPGETEATVLPCRSMLRC